MDGCLPSGTDNCEVLRYIYLLQPTRYCTFLILPDHRIDLFPGFRHRLYPSQYSQVDKRLENTFRVMISLLHHIYFMISVNFLRRIDFNKMGRTRSISLKESSSS